MSIHSIEKDQLFVEVVKSGRIEIFEDGRVRNNRTGRFVGCPNSNGYFHFSLHIDGKCKSMYIHRLVYLIFKGDIPEGYTVNHDDGNKQNNNINNLSLMTPSQNISHAYESGLIPIEKRRGENSGNSKFTNKQVIMLRERYANKQITLNEIASAYSVNVSSARNMINGTSYPHLHGAVKITKNKLSDKDVFEAVKMRKKGLSCAKIGKIFGVHEETIRTNTKDFL